MRRIVRSPRRLAMIVLVIALLLTVIPSPSVFAAPPKQGTPIYHVVQRGETLGIIARRYGVTVNQLVAWNNIPNPDFIQIGQRLIVGYSDGAAPSAPAPAPAAPAPAPAAPAPANTGDGLRYGLQAHMIYTDRGQIINATKGLGFGWLKQQIEWKAFEPSEGAIQWGEMDAIVNDVTGNGLGLLFSIVKSPAWARAGGRGDGEGPPQNGQTYANFVGAVAGRYCGKVAAIEVWNEQNLVVEWADRAINASDYVNNLLRPAYASIKAACPGMIVVSGALTPAGNVGNLARDDIEYLAEMYASGLKNYSDAIGAHPSGFNCPADADWRTVTDPSAAFRGPFDNRHHSWCFRGTMEGYRNVMVANGDGAKKIWVTEFGWAVSGNPHPGYEYARDNTYEEQARWITQAYQMAAAWGWVGGMFLWNLNFQVVNPGGEVGAFGIVDPAWQPYPAYAALRDMPKTAGTGAPGPAPAAPAPGAPAPAAPAPSSPPPAATAAPPAPTATPVPTHPFSHAGTRGERNGGLTQIRGIIRDRAGQPVNGVRVRVCSEGKGWCSPPSYPSGNPGQYPAGEYDVVLDVRAKDGKWVVFVSDNDGKALSPEVTVETSDEGNSVIYVDWVKN
ncbi:MAG TPA: LysM peptidoglycan-binding domain-containing protein [Ardenticatenaceae bacterium]|nr:LysM peptidoglycan-binding domain-containing protein [Ardenticatenaceae bacterium]